MMDEHKQLIYSAAESLKRENILTVACNNLQDPQHSMGSFNRHFLSSLNPMECMWFLTYLTPSVLFCPKTLN